MDGHRRAALGTAAEVAAAEYLSGLGMDIVELDARLPSGQVDVVALDRGRLVIVEVKARSSHAFGLPAEAVDHRKRQRLRRLAGEYISAHPDVGYGVRIDIVGVDLDGEGRPGAFRHYPAIELS
ncbi:MAG: YraN family protein [Candidatus Dormibacteria bacterium]